MAMGLHAINLQIVLLASLNSNHGSRQELRSLIAKKIIEEERLEKFLTQ